MLPLNLRPMELIIILVLVLIVFGAGKLPEVGASIGKGIREFRKSISGAGEESPAESDKSRS